MSTAVLYLCESGGARIFAYGSGISQVGTNYQASLQTWDALPVGESGTALFRSIDVTLKTGGGFTIGITPTIDGVDQTEQTFSGAGSGQAKCQALIGMRGTRIAATVRTISRSGDLEFENVTYTHVPLRAFP